MGKLAMGNLAEMAPSGAQPSADALELTIVLPCLNEAETVGLCVAKAVGWLRDNDIAGEVVVADNGSTDESPELGTRRGARVVTVRRKGYGNALITGIRAACAARSCSWPMPTTATTSSTSGRSSRTSATATTS